jgi:hypothetical protein
VHPSARILIYLISALALPGLSFFALSAIAAALPLVFRDRFGAMLALVWRARWLFLLIGLGYAYGLPGGAAWPALGDWSPSLPGLATAGLQMVRLLLLLWLLDVLVVGMAAERMMAGLHGLFAGLAWLGFPAERTTVRLGLTLQAMERNSLKLRDLSALLGDAGMATGVATAFSLPREPWRPRDTQLVLLALLGALGSWLA